MAQEEFPLTDEQKIEWIKRATFHQLREKWMNDPIGSPWFTKAVGKVMVEYFLLRKREHTLKRLTN